MAAWFTEPSPDVSVLYLLLLVNHRGFNWPSKWLSCYICGAIDVDCLGVADSVSGVAYLELPSPFNAQITSYCSRLA